MERERELSVCERTKFLFMKKIKLQIKRVYEEPSPPDGTRVLVDRIWPRGLSKEKAHLDHWYKEVAPSTELRKWFAHKEERFQKFKEKYREELAANDSEELQDLIKLITSGPVTLLFAAKDEADNNAVVLRDFLSRRVKG
jgi:uncharacterized protein YeaO (DUF488 family)